MRTYDTYKDSGISWLGQIPSHWDVRRTKTIWEEHVSLSETGTEQLLSVSQYDGVKPNDEGSRSESLVGYKVVDSSNLVINIMLAWLGGLGVSQYKGIVSPAYCVYKLKENHCPEYFHYLYRTAMYLAEFARKSTGVVPSRWRMYTDSFGTVLSIVPPRDEQEAIVAYLDNATAEIDKAIASQQRMVELLQERKQIIINQAVSQGLNPDALMKPTNIDWRPQIPAHWDLRRLKYVSQDYKAGPFGSSLITSELNTNGSILVYTPEHIANQSTDIEGNLYLPESRKNEMSQFFIKPGDIIFPIVGSLGRAMIIQKGMPTGIINQRLAKFNIKSCYLNNDYFMWLFAYSTVYNDYIILTQRGSIIVNLTKGIIGNIPIPLPSLEEQKRIVSHIIESTKPINAAISRCERKIELLTERKQILINEVVTGKIKVS